MTSGISKHNLPTLDPQLIDNFYKFEIDPLDFAKNRNFFDDLKKEQARGLDGPDAALARAAGARILNDTVYGANAWVTVQATRYASVVGCAIRGIVREWTLRHDGDPDHALQTEGMLIVDESTMRQPHFRFVLGMPPASKKGERLVVLTNPSLIQTTTSASDEFARLMAERAEDESTTTITFSPGPLRILPQPVALVAFKEQMDVGFAIHGAEINEVLTTPTPAIDYRDQFEGTNF